MPLTLTLTLTLCAADPDPDPDPVCRSLLQADIAVHHGPDRKKKCGYVSSRGYSLKDHPVDESLLKSLAVRSKATTFCVYAVFLTPFCSDLCPPL